MHLMNEGKEMHQAMIVRLEDGKTVADFGQAMKSDGPPPPWVKFVGGPNGIVPGATTTATTRPDAGELRRDLRDPRSGRGPARGEGYGHPFEVTAATGAEAALPAATDTVLMKDYGFEGRPLAAGSTPSTWRTAARRSTSWCSSSSRPARR